jgi:hypothetical protein
MRQYATSQKVGGISPNQAIEFLFNLPNPPIRAMALGFTQPLTKMNSRRFLWGKERPTHKAGKLTTICELIV